MLTVGAIANRIGTSTYRVRYAIHRAGIPPRGKAGLYNLYDEEDIAAIERALQGIGRLVRPFPGTVEAR